MRFLRKPDGIPSEFAGLVYGRDTAAIRERLLRIQKGFCAYSEKRFEPTDSVDVEHFNPLMKPTPQDGFRNWYAALGKINGRRARRRLKEFLPLPDPGTAEVQSRIKFGQGLFQPVDGADEEMRRLISFIRANDALTIEHRDNHVSQIADLKRWMTQVDLEQHLLQHPELLSFPSALETELGIPAFTLIERLHPQPAAL